MRSGPLRIRRQLLACSTTAKTVGCFPTVDGAEEIFARSEEERASWVG
jgi:hypothetical protein